MQRGFTIPALVTLAMGCGSSDYDVSWVLVQREVGELDIGYPFTYESPDGTYAVHISSRMDFERDGHGVWTTDLTYVEDSVERDERSAFTLFSHAEGVGWAIDLDSELNMECTRPGNDLLCTDIAGVDSVWISDSRREER